MVLSDDFLSFLDDIDWENFDLDDLGPPPPPPAPWGSCKKDCPKEEEEDDKFDLPPPPPPPDMITCTKKCEEIDDDPFDLPPPPPVPDFPVCTKCNKTEEVDDPFDMPPPPPPPDWIQCTKCEKEEDPFDLPPPPPPPDWIQCTKCNKTDECPAGEPHNVCRNILLVDEVCPDFDPVDASFLDSNINFNDWNNELSSVGLDYLNTTVRSCVRDEAVVCRDVCHEPFT